MSHVVIIIERAPPDPNDPAHAGNCSYTYQIPLPHDVTPQQVGELTRKAFKRLEGNDSAD